MRSEDDYRGPERRQDDVDHGRRLRRQVFMVLLLFGVFQVIALGLVECSSDNANDAANNATRAAKDAKRSADRANKAIRRGREEARQRRDADCEFFEQAQKDEVDQLRDTYKYLEVAITRPPDLLFDFAIAQLPETLEKAKDDQAPGYCDNEGLGLPEPDPVLPKRPPELGG